MAALGHPIVSDRLYMMNDADYLAWAANKPSDDAPLPRHALHCAQTTIWHPGLERPFTATAPLAPDIHAFLRSLAPTQHNLDI
jgi:23S rRNA-/tRNA-specific pseudouridylate synthase